ncbi:MAG TPA: hypothetical protein VLH40_00610 [Atribacteraceae bacterium]|nr:hypothetical protein [Atribacteraceae bacterium]
MKVMNDFRYFITKSINRLRRAKIPPPSNTIPCPFCLEMIPGEETCCRFCTSYLNETLKGALVR